MAFGFQTLTKRIIYGREFACGRGAACDAGAWLVESERPLHWAVFPVLFYAMFGYGTSDPLLNGCQRGQITTELNWAIDHAKYYQCHVVALGRACSEYVGCLHDPGNAALSGEAGAADDRLDQSLFAPFGEIGVHRFTEAVGVDHK